MNDGAGAQERAGRGRGVGPVWPWVLLALLVVLAGGSVGFFSTRPIYRSAAELICEGEGPDLEFVGPIVRSPSCIEQAMADPGWKALGRPVTPRATSAFRNSIGVNRVSKFAATVTFNDPDPKAAQASLVALIKAWRQASEGMRIATLQSRMALLTERMTNLMYDLKAAKARIHAITDGSDAIVEDYAWKARFDELMRLKRLVDDAELAELTRPAATRPTTVRTGLAAMKERYERESEELHKLRVTRAQLDDLRAEANEAQRQVTLSKEELDRKNLEQRFASGVRVLSDGDLPGIPAIDARPRRAALGAAAGLAVFVLIGLVRRWSSRRAKSLRGAFPVVVAGMANAGAPVEPASV
jgi:uncharacterized protein involved in exopolysaccharide biosynthesis